jgi:hypothetical protein
MLFTATENEPLKAVGNEEEKFAAIYQLSELIDDFFDINEELK